MALFCVDTHTVVWGVRKVATPGQEDMISRAETFLQRCEVDGHRVIVPTIVLAELLAAIPVENQPEFVRTMQRRFLLAPFDAAAALVYGRLWQAHRERIIPDARREIEDITRAEIKADHMITAVAVARHCDALCTTDRALIRFAEQHIRIVHLSQVTVQGRLLE